MIGRLRDRGQGLRRILESDKGIEIVGEASTGFGGITQAGDPSPDVILLSMDRPGPTGQHLRRRTAEIGLASRVAFLSKADEDLGRAIANSTLSGPTGAFASPSLSLLSELWTKRLKTFCAVAAPTPRANQENSGLFF